MPQNFPKTPIPFVQIQRTPWGGGKKKGEANLTKDTPPKKGFWTPLRLVRFPTPLRCRCPVSLYKNPRLSTPEALLEGSENFWRARCLVRFPPPVRFAPPHIMAQQMAFRTESHCSQINFALYGRYRCRRKTDTDKNYFGIKFSLGDKRAVRFRKRVLLANAPS